MQLVGKLFQVFNKFHVYDNTVCIFTSFHWLQETGLGALKLNAISFISYYLFY